MVPDTAPPIRVFLIDDHRTILWGLEKLIETGKPPMRVVGTATSYNEALKILDKASPHVILLDLDLGQESGLDAIPKLIAASPARILVLTGVRDESVHQNAVLAGARGVVEKEARAESILAAIAKVHEGEVWLDRAATGKLLFEISRKNAGRADPEQQKIASLTVREREIIALTAANAGATAKAIAEKLHISEHTLRNHLTSIYEKLGVANRLELFAFAHQHKLAKPRSP